MKFFNKKKKQTTAFIIDRLLQLQKTYGLMDYTAEDLHNYVFEGISYNSYSKTKQVFICSKCDLSMYVSGYSRVMKICNEIFIICENCQFD